MPVYKDAKTNTWRAVYRFTDWTGERKQTQKRGFATRREAQAWEREMLNQKTADVDMTFASFIELYTEDVKSRMNFRQQSERDLSGLQQSVQALQMKNDALQYKAEKYDAARLVLDSEQMEQIINTERSKTRRREQVI